MEKLLLKSLSLEGSFISLCYKSGQARLGSFPFLFFNFGKAGIEKQYLFMVQIL